MDIFLHTSDQRSALDAHYRIAFDSAVELYVVSAYLTEWRPSFKLSAACKRFRMIVGKDFGITRKSACKEVLKWLPATRKSDFLVADQISGFHPKAAFWRNADGQTFMLIGSSNLSRAAFDGNVEANVAAPITVQAFEDAKAWIDWIEERSAPVSEDWLNQYVEAERKPGGSAGRGGTEPGSPVVAFKLPRPDGMADLLRARRAQLAAYEKRRPGLIKLFKQCATAKISSQKFFDDLPNHWRMDLGNRLQGRGWERAGKRADFQALAIVFIAIMDASKSDRDDVVRIELDRLNKLGNPARKAFLSEMLCLRFPDEYPVLNRPVKEFLSENRFTAPRGASEGARYIDLAKKLRLALRANPKYPAKNLAELDHLIWASSEQNS